MAVLIAEQLSTLSFHQDDHLGNAAHYDRFTTRVEVACQARVCYYSPALLEDKATQPKLGDFDKLSSANKKKIIDQVKQEYLAYLFLNNSNAKMHTQLKKEAANDYSKGNTDAYLNNIHKALTLMNEYKPLKLDTPLSYRRALHLSLAQRIIKRKVGTRLLSQTSTSRHLSRMRLVLKHRQRSSKPGRSPRPMMMMTSPPSQQPSASQSSLSPRCSSLWKRANKSLRGQQVCSRSARSMTIPTHQYLLQRGQATSRRLWRCLRSTTPRLF